MTDVVLDVNLWSYLTARHELAAFLDMKASVGIRVVTPPSLLVEVLATSDSMLRRSIVDTIRRATDTRLRTEAALEADELVAEARRCRPSWLRAEVDSSTIRRLDDLWLRRVWTNAVAGNPALSSFVVADETSDRLAEWQRTSRSTAEAAGVRLDDTDLLAEPNWPSAETVGWSGDRLPVWRLDLAQLFWHQLITLPRRAARTGADTTYADWVGAQLDLRQVGSDRASFNRFWFYEVRREALSRNWLHTVVLWAQAAGKIQRSNASDAQHAAYLPDCDYLLSADKRLVRILSLVKASGPSGLGTPLAVKATGQSIVVAIADALSRRR